MPLDPLSLSKELIRSETVTPVTTEDGFYPIIEALAPLGFKFQYLTFSEAGHDPVVNLLLTIGSGSPHLCFAGHMDVVPPGSLGAWDQNPFEPYEKNGMLIGRGTSDMKCAIACFAAAVSEYLEKNPLIEGCGKITFLLTGDEEGPAINGTEKMLRLCYDNQYIFDACIVGEPTSHKTVGDTIKIGRRGSITFYVTIVGTQGHVAYPTLANNPIPALCDLITNIQHYLLDNGSTFFDPSNLEVVSISTDSQASNVIPGEAKATFNIRFSDVQNPIELRDWLEAQCQTICKKHHVTYRIQYRVSAYAFGGKPDALALLTANAVHQVTGTTPIFSTSGGTSDARFIRHYTPVAELGLQNATAHQVNEQVAITDLYTLTAIYRTLLEKWFAGDIKHIQEQLDATAALNADTKISLEIEPVFLTKSTDCSNIV